MSKLMLVNDDTFAVLDMRGGGAHTYHVRVELTAKLLLLLKVVDEMVRTHISVTEM